MLRDPAVDHPLHRSRKEEPAFYRQVQAPNLYLRNQGDTTGPFPVSSKLNKGGGPTSVS